MHQCIIAFAMNATLHLVRNYCTKRFSIMRKYNRSQYTNMTRQNKHNNVMNVIFYNLKNMFQMVRYLNH